VIVDAPVAVPERCEISADHNLRGREERTGDELLMRPVVSETALLDEARDTVTLRPHLPPRRWAADEPPASIDHATLKIDSDLLAPLLREPKLTPAARAVARQVPEELRVVLIPLALPTRDDQAWDRNVVPHP
jgi:hypothetical protein